MRILLYVAMQEEANPIIAALNLQPCSLLPQALPMRTFSAQDELHEYLLVLAGSSVQHAVENVGTEPAALALGVALSIFPAALIINAGTAGGFARKGAQIAEVFLGKSPVRYHDHRIPLGDYESYGTGSYACIDSTPLAQLLSLKQGYISTGNSLDMNSDDLEHLNNNQADCKEMEAAALAWVASLYKVPFLPIKVITDLVDNEQNNTAEQFLQNLKQANIALTQTLIRLLALPDLSVLIKN